MIETMMRYMLDRQAPGYTSTIMHCVSLLIDMIRHNNSDLDQQTPQNEPDFFVSLSDLLQVITAHIEPLNQILLDRDRKTVGLDRLKICELYAELLHCSNMSSLQSENRGDNFKSACHQYQVVSIMIVK